MAPKFLRSLEHWMNKVIHPSRPHKISRRERKNFSFLSTFLCPCLVFVSSKQRDKVLATRRALIGWNSMVYQSTGAQQARVNCKCKIFANVTEIKHYSWLKQTPSPWEANVNYQCAKPMCNQSRECICK